MSTQSNPRKTTVNHVLSGVGTLFGVPTPFRKDMSTLAEALDAMDVLPWMAADIRLFPWMVDAAKSIYTSDKDCPMVQELIAYAGDVMWVKDSVRRSRGGLWLVFAEETGATDSHFSHALSTYFPTMVVGHVQAGDEMYRLVGVHAESLTKTLK